MDELILMAIAGMVFGLALAFYLAADQLKDSNEMGNSKCGRLDYITAFNIFDLKNDVPKSLDINDL